MTCVQPARGAPVARTGAALPDEEWVARLSVPGPDRDDAIRLLHDLLIRAARHQVNRMPDAASWGTTRRAEIVHAAADEATVAVLARLDSFAGRSRFTTWAFKFGILQAGVEVRRTAWKHREIDLDSIPEPPARGGGPESYVEVRDLAAATRQGMYQVLTPHQRRVAVALLVEEIPIDVLAERLATNRNALYQTLHEVRKRLRAYLSAEGYLGTDRAQEASR